MQSIFRLPWCSDPIAPKVVADHAALDKMRAPPVVEIPMLNKLKRKRAISSDVAPPRAHDQKKQRVEAHGSQLQLSTSVAPPTPDITETSTETLEAKSAAATATADRIQTQSPAQMMSSQLMADHQPPVEPMAASTDTPILHTQPTASHDVNGLTPLQQVIENQFNMQILMKHNELRLIEQELAKCQVALEQLRRCELRPYPGSDRPSEAVTSGSGPAIAPRPGYTRPSHPAPYGVTDGPYSRHYNQWLLQDPQFDSVPVHLLQSEATGRPTRNSGPARRSVGQPFTFPGRPTQTLPSIPNYPAPAPKERNLPNVLRRSTDGQLVKLICNNCQRGNFSSIQGFLNHCRIAHKVDYKSHDAAAIDCGRPLEEGEAAVLPPEPLHTPAPKPAPSRVSSAAPTSNRNLVHSFNTMEGASGALNQTQQPTRQPVPSLSSASLKTSQTPFTASGQLPRLSAHFAKHQLGGDLAKAAAEAKQRIEFVDDDYPSPDTSEQNSPLGTPSISRTVGGRTGSLGINSASIPGAPSRKGFRQPTTQQQSKPRPSPLAPLAGNIKQEPSSESPESPHSHHSHHHLHSSSADLSPHTADSNPGLVSDHEDDDEHGSASESEDHHPPTTGRLPVTAAGTGTTCGAGVGVDEMELDVAVEDDEGIDADGLVIRRNSLSASETTATAVGRKFGGVAKRSG